MTKHNCWIPLRFPSSIRIFHKYFSYVFSVEIFLCFLQIEFQKKVKKLLTHLSNFLNDFLMGSGIYWFSTQLDRIWISNSHNDEQKLQFNSLFYLSSTRVVDVEKWGTWFSLRVVIVSWYDELYQAQTKSFPSETRKEKKIVNNKSVLSFFKAVSGRLFQLFYLNSWSIFFMFKWSNPNCFFIACESYIFCKVILMKIWILVGLSEIFFNIFANVDSDKLLMLLVELLRFESFGCKSFWNRFKCKDWFFLVPKSIFWGTFT
jgi:hypothetical protein